MVTETDGVILRQTKTVKDRIILVLLTRKLGKISAGTGTRTFGKRKSSLPLRAFTHGRYQLYSGRQIYNVDSADVIESYYGIGENPDSFFCASYVLEFTDRVLPEGMPAEHVLDTLTGMLRILSRRKTRLKSLLLMYQWKVLQILGYMPGLDACVRCGSTEEPAGLSVVDGGIICGHCRDSGTVNMRLLYELNFDIIQILKFIQKNEIEAFSKLTFRDDTAEHLGRILESYLSYHLDVRDLRSASYINFD